MSLPESVRKLLSEGPGIFSRALQLPSDQHHVFFVDCAMLPDPNPGKHAKAWLDDQKESSVGKLFYNHLPHEKKPCLYRFEIVEGQSTEVIFNAYQQFRQSKPKRATAAVKKELDFNTNTLYVGKVKENVQVRMVTHTGHYRADTTAGLQLCHWAKDLQLKLKVHIFAFEEEMKPFISSFELEFSKEYKPLIGMQ
jgi:hypothetical protein